MRRIGAFWAIESGMNDKSSGLWGLETLRFISSPVSSYVFLMQKQNHASL